MSKEKNLKTSDTLSEFILYTAPSGDVKVEINFQNETIWLSQDKIALLFGVQRPAVTKHLKNIFDSNELQEQVVCSILELPTLHGAIKGKTQVNKTKYYTDFQSYKEALEEYNSREKEEEEEEEEEEGKE